MGQRCTRASDPAEVANTGSPALSDYDFLRARFSCESNEHQTGQSQSLSVAAEADEIGGLLQAIEDRLASSSNGKRKMVQQHAPVKLNIYNLGRSEINNGLNTMLRPLGTGIWHCGVEVYGCEWSFANTPDGTGDGIFGSIPKRCMYHSYEESLHMGMTAYAEQDVLQLISLLSHEWPASSYDNLNRNCCHFCDELCKRLGCGTIPSWVSSAAGFGAALVATAHPMCCREVGVKVCNNHCCPGDAVDDFERDQCVDVVDQMPAISRSHKVGRVPTKIESM